MGKETVVDVKGQVACFYVAEGAKDRRVKSIQVQYNTWWGTPTFQTLEIGVSSKR